MASLACLAALGLAGCDSDPEAALAKCEEDAVRDAIAEWQAALLLALCQEEFAKNAPPIALSSEELEEGSRTFDASRPRTATNPTTGERFVLVNNQWVPMPITLTAFRRQFPQYDDMSDTALADALHRRYYSDLPKDEFFRRIEFTPTPAPAQPAAVEEQSWGEWLSEMPL